jgi:hypothetical protein
MESLGKVFLADVRAKKFSEFPNILEKIWYVNCFVMGGYGYTAEKVS